ncbi:MAG: FtsX-like permease family protein [Bacteroidales bacterium]|jgi:ABC-type lipoprotein release transport system permease subunit|nr:FtsX-like permease family protein [Bacteroidales bacterium]
MRNYKMAWRNLWRNRRRTLITVASVFFAVFFALVMRSLQLGAYDHMFRNIIESYTGYLQIQHEDFWDTRSIDNLIENSPELEKLILKNENADLLIPRIESFALASSGEVSKGVLVMGVDPEREKYLSNIGSRLIKYYITEESIELIRNSGAPEDVAKRISELKGNAYPSNSSLELDLGIRAGDSASLMPLIRSNTNFRNGYIKSGESSVLTGKALAEYLKLSVGDTIVLIGQGYRGASAAGKYRVAGIVKLPSPDLDNKIVYLPLDVCQELYDAPGMVTSLAVSVKDNGDRAVDAMTGLIGKELSPPLKAMDWRQMNELLINQMEGDNKSGMVMIAILYLVIAFGIFGTVLMMTAERRREFGVLVAVGMQKTKLARVVVFEMLYIGFMGILSGTLAAMPVIIYGYLHPIRFTGEMGKMYEDYGLEPVMPFLPADWYIVWQMVVVAVIVLIALIYPVRKIMRTDVVKSLKA